MDPLMRYKANQPILCNVNVIIVMWSFFLQRVFTVFIKNITIKSYSDNNWNCHAYQLPLSSLSLISCHIFYLNR